MRNVVIGALFFVLYPMHCMALDIQPSDIRNIPSTGIKQVDRPNGDTYIVAAGIEEKISGIPTSTILDMAAMKARTNLAQFIHGETFERIIRINQYSASAGKVGTSGSSTSSTYVSKMKEKALNEVEVVLEDTSNPDVVKVVVAVKLPRQ